MHTFCRGPEGRQPVRRAALGSPKSSLAAYERRYTSDFLPPPSRKFLTASRRGVALRGSRAETRVWRRDLTMQRCPAARVPMPRHQPLPLHAWCPVLLRTGAAGKRRAAVSGHCAGRGWARSWGLLQNAGAGARPVGARATIGRLNMLLRRPTSPVPRGRAFCCTQAAGGRWVVGSVGSSRFSTCCTPHACAFEQTIAHFHSHRLLTHCRHVQLQACASRPSFLLHPKRCWLASPRSSSQQGYAVCNTQCYTRCIV